ncbi:MAG: hypothetical protein JNK66_04625 [Chitinophagales bacterium]|nr:hypothetical protein [Chitinophagales bacterium]
MKKIISALCIVTLCAISFAQGDFEWDKKIENVNAKIELMADGETALIIPDADPNIRYVAQQLPAEFKKNGLRIKFSGMEGKIPPHVRMMGKPLKLFWISITKKEKRKNKIKKAKYVFE